MAAKRKAADRMFSKKPFSLDNMKAININLKTVVEQLIAADGTDLGDLSFSAMMKDGHFTLSNFKMADYAVVHADLNAKQTVELNVDAKLKKMPLSLFFAKRTARCFARSATHFRISESHNFTCLPLLWNARCPITPLYRFCPFRNRNTPAKFGGHP